MSTCPTCQTAFDDGVLVCPSDGTNLGGGDPLIGRTLGDRYRVLARIGEGGMGTVYRVEHVVLGKRMAVKVLRPEFSTDEDLVRRFQREAVAASRIGQENIVDVVDFGRTREGNLYFVMEELDGVSLASVLHAAGPLPFDRAARILAQVCRALGAAHGHGIVHRDLKPDNVIVVRHDDGTDLVKVVDFGISKSAGDGEDRLTRAGTIIGTPEYMAPEQGAAASVDHRADVYAFGILAYELITGTVPFQGATAIAILIEHQTKPPEPPGRRRDGVPAALEQLILKCMEKRREARYQSMVEVAEQLSEVLALFGLPPVYDKTRTPPPLPVPPGFTVRFHTPVKSARGGTVAIEPLPAPSGQIAVPPEAAAQLDRRRRAGRRVAAGAVVLAALAVVAAWVSFGPASERGGLGASSRGAQPASAAPSPPLAPGQPQPAAPALAATPTPTAVVEPPPPQPRLQVTVRTVPPGADVLQGTLRVGRTPWTPSLARGEEVEVRLVKEGFEPAVRRVSADAGDLEVTLLRPPKLAAQARPKAPAARKPAGASGPEVEPERRTDENPYGKIDDLKPDPF
jgi:serine/threonine-protein kinase